MRRVSEGRRIVSASLTRRCGRVMCINSYGGFKV